jgi:hypothetical protein
MICRGGLAGEARSAPPCPTRIIVGKDGHVSLKGLKLI